MKTRDVLIAVVAAVLIGTAGYLWFGGQSDATRAPNVHMKLLDGKTIDLASLRGHPVLINFWATTCPGCVAEMPDLSKLYQELAPQGFKLIGVAMYYDPQAQVRAMEKARTIPYPIAIDGNADISNAFGKVRLTPTSFLIDAKGRIVYQKLGNLNFTQLHARIEKMLAADKKVAVSPSSRQTSVS